jgi:hypothetical protein
MTDQHPEPKSRINLLYLGVREFDRGKPLSHLWYDLTDIPNDGELLKEDRKRHQFYGSKKRGHSTKNLTVASPGAIYSFEKSPDGVYGSTAHYVGRWANGDDIVRWTAESNAIDRAAELAERGKKDAKDRLDWDALGPFRLAYNGSLNYRQQQMLLAQIMQYVTRHKKEDDE